MLPLSPKEGLKTQSDRFSYKSGFVVSMLLVLSLCGTTTFGAEYCLTHAITHHPPKTDSRTLQRGLPAIAELLVDTV